MVSSRWKLVRRRGARCVSGVRVRRLWWRKQVELIRAARDVVELDCGEVLSVEGGEQVYRQIYKKNWADSELRTVGLFLNGKEIPARTRWGEQVGMLFNAGAEAVTFRLPSRRFGIRWKLELSTAEPELPEGDRSYAARSEVRVEALSLVLLRRGW